MSNENEIDLFKKISYLLKEIHESQKILSDKNTKYSIIITTRFQPDYITFEKSEMKMTINSRDELKETCNIKEEVLQNLIQKHSNFEAARQILLMYRQKEEFEILCKNKKDIEIQYNDKEETLQKIRDWLQTFCNERKIDSDCLDDI
jgi:hypothetical protein